MKTILFGLALALVVCIVILGLLNRGSEKVIVAILSGLGVSTLALLISIVFSENHNSKTVLASALYYRSADFALQPPSNGWRSSVHFILGFPAAPLRIPTTDNERRLTIHQILQAALIFELRKLSSPTYDLTTKEVNVPWITSNQRALIGGDPASKSDEIKGSEIAKAAPTNPFLAEGAFANEYLLVPEGMKLTIEAPRPSFAGSQFDVGMIQLRNSLATLRISTAVNGGEGSGVPVEIEPFIAAELYDSVDYRYQGLQISIEATYSRFRTGDPQMQALRNWIEAVTKSISADFGEEQLWSEYKSYSEMLLRFKQFDAARRAAVLKQSTIKMPISPKFVKRLSSKKTR